MVTDLQTGYVPYTPKIQGTLMPVRMPPIQRIGPFTPAPTPTLPAPPVSAGGPPSPIVKGGPVIPSIPPDSSSGTTGGTAGDSGSGGTAMSGLDDLFGAVGNAFNNLTHPGTDQTTSGASQPTSNANSLFTWLIIGAVVYFLFLR